MSVSKLSAGTGYRYLLKHIARGDADQTVDRSGALTDYYTVSGYPPGVWLGRGLAGLGDGAVLAAGSVVGEEQMARLFGTGADPVTGAPLGRPYRTGLEGSSGSVAGFDLTFSPAKSVSVLWALADEPVRRVIVAAHHAAVAQTLGVIERDVARTRTGHAGSAVLPIRGLVAAGFDHYDSRAGDPQLHTHVTVANRVQGLDGMWRTLHGTELFRATVAMSATYDALLADHLTRQVGLTWETRRRGSDRNPAHELAGIPERLITEFSRRTAAINDTSEQAIARFTADHGRAPTGAEAAAMRQHATLTTRQAKHTRPLADYTTQWRARAAEILHTDPIAWTAALLGLPAPAPTAPAVSVPAAPNAAHSKRSRTRDEGTLALFDVEGPPLGPAPARPETEHARPATPIPRLLTAAHIPDAAVTAVADQVLAATEERRSTWSRWNLTAETIRAIRDRGWQFATPRDLLLARDRVLAQAIGQSVSLDPPELAEVPAQWRDPTTGRSAFAGPQTFTSRAVLDAEARLLDAARDRSAPTAPALSGDHSGSLEQVAAAQAICESGRTLDVLVGPAGTGKTATINRLAAQWRAEHGNHSVLLLAVSAAATDILATATGTPAETAAMWLTRHNHRDQDLARHAEVQRLRAAELWTNHLTPALDEESDRLARRLSQTQIRPGSLLILDEAGMADVHTLDRLTAAATAAGAKILLVGDDQQLSPVGPGGSFGMLVAHRQDTPHLSNIQRFRDPDGTTRTWEAHASAQLRVGDPAALQAYTDHNRIRGGDRATMLDAAYRAWRIDTDNGLDSLLLAADNQTVTHLNRRAQTDRVADGRVHTDGLLLADGTTAAVGDRIITRRNDRTLHPAPSAAGHRDPAPGFVRNGQQFTVTATHPDGSLTAADRTGRTVALPAAYVAEHVQLGYAATIHRAQGATVDTSHVIASPGMTRQALYVALTRGRGSNIAYTITEMPDPPGTLDRIGPATPVDTPIHAFARILVRDGADASAHTTLRRTFDQAGSRRQLLIGYAQIAEDAHHQRVAALIDTLGPAFTPAARTREAPGLGDLQIHRLTRAIRGGDHYGLNPERLLPQIADGAADLDQLTDHYERAAHHAQREHGDHPAVRTLRDGQPTATIGITDPDIRRALLQREELINRTPEIPDHAAAPRTPSTTASTTHHPHPNGTSASAANSHPRHQESTMTAASHRQPQPVSRLARRGRLRVAPAAPPPLTAQLNDENRLLSTREASLYTPYSPQGLANLRSAGRGPAYIKIHGGAVAYRLIDLINWQEENRVSTLDQA